MTDKKAIADKINAYTLDDVKALSLLLLTQNEHSDAVSLNDFANSTVALVLNTITEHTSNDGDCLACVLKASWALAINALSYLVENDEDATDGLIRVAHNMIRDADEQMESSRGE